MYSESILLCRKLYVWVGLYVAVQLISTIASSSTIDSVAMGIASMGYGILWIVLWMSLSYHAYAALLSEQMDSQVSTARRFVGLTIRTIVLLIITMLLIGIVVGAAVGLSVGLFSLDVSWTPGSPFMAAFTVMIVPVMSLAMIVVYSLWGTSLPACVAGRRHGFWGHFRLGKAQFWQTAGLLFIGPTVLNVLAQALNLLFSKVTTGSYVATPEMWSAFTSDGQLNIAVIVVQLFNGLVGSLVVVMSAWVMSKTYFNAVGRNTVASVFE